MRTQNRSAARPQKKACPLVRAVQADVADQDVAFGGNVLAARRVDDQAASRQALADVVVGVAFQFQRDAAGQKRAEALTGRT